MNKLVWTPEMNVDVVEVDVRHQQIFEAVNHFIEQLETRGASESQLIDQLHLLGTLCHENLEFEEELLEDHHYPAIDIIKFNHKEFFRVFDKFEEEFNQSDEKGFVAETVIPYMMSWLVQHFLGLDHQAGRFLSRKH